MLTLAAERLYIFRASEKICMLASGKKFAAVLGWLSIVVAAWFLARACALALPPPALPAAPTLSSTATLPDQKSGPRLPPFAHFSVLETNNLFNLNSHAPAVAALQPQAKALNAILMGTVDAPLPEHARAVIQYQGKQYMLRPGESIAGFVLKEIRRGIAAFEANGRIAELVTGNSGDLRPGSARAQNADQQPDEPQQEVLLSVPLAVASLAVASLAAPEVRDILVPNEDASGLVVRETAGNLILTTMNLKPGDVLTGVNGKPATIITDSRQMMRELESGSLTISLLREGRQESVTLRISDRNE